MSSGFPLVSLLAAVMTVAFGLGGLGCSSPAPQSDDFARMPVASANTPFGYAMLDSLLKQHVNETGFVDYAGLKSERHKLGEFVKSMGALSESELASWSQEERLAFWINAYNAITLLYVVDNYPIQKGGIISGALYPANSIRQIPGVWDRLTTAVAGTAITLNDIEHQILRTQFSEPRIHVAIVCASVGCPPLRNEAFVAERLEEQFSDQSRKFLAHPDRFRIDRERNIVYLSSIFDWFGKDFVPKYKPPVNFRNHGESVSATLNFAAHYIPDVDAEYLRNQQFSVKFTDYDWSLNGQ